MINVNRDLLGAALGGNMLGACQRRPATVAGKPEEILRDERYGASRAPLPRRVSRRIDDNLTHDSPTSMVRIAARNEEPGQRLGYPHSSGLRPVTVQVPQRRTHVPAALDRPGELPGGPPRLASFIVDTSTVLDPEGRPPCRTPPTRVQSPPLVGQGAPRLLAPRETRPLDGRDRMRALRRLHAHPWRTDRAVSGRPDGRSDRAGDRARNRHPVVARPEASDDAASRWRLRSGPRRSVRSDAGRPRVASQIRLNGSLVAEPEGRSDRPYRARPSPRLGGRLLLRRVEPEAADASHGRFAAVPRRPSEDPCRRPL